MSELNKLITDATSQKPKKLENTTNDYRIDIDSDKAVDTVIKLKEIGYNYLTMLTATCKDEGFEIIYLLDNWKYKSKVWIYTKVSNDKPIIPSLTPHWIAADWLEREVYDMFGIEFEGHPNMTRLLTPFDFESFPLRKDFTETD